MHPSNRSSTPLRSMSSRFDSLKSKSSDDNYTNSHNNRNRDTQKQSSSTLFSVKSSLTDFLPTSVFETQKYVSPAMRRREQQQQQPQQQHHTGQNRFADRNQFTRKSKQNKKQPVLDFSGVAFPSMSGAKKTNMPTSISCDKYATAAAMEDDDYQTQQREIASTMNDNTEFMKTDMLGENYHEENDSYCENPKEPVCPHAAAAAAMGTLREYQYKRDEQNQIFGAQSPYWNTKSLMDFDIDSDDDSNYAESSSDENGVEDDDY